jgi:hypothetical protein
LEETKQKTAILPLETAVSPLKAETPFIFEEPKRTYFELDFAKRQVLFLLGPMAPQWLNYIERVHVVHQSLFKTQVTVAHRQDMPHYQAPMTMMKASTFKSIIIYRDGYTNPDMNDDFVYIMGRFLLILMSKLREEHQGFNDPWVVFCDIPESCHSRKG